MANVQTGQANIDTIRFVEGAAAGTPPSGYFYIYVKTDGKIYGKDDAGTEYDLTSTVAGGDSTAIHDNVAAEISAITAKGSPTTSDYLLIEDAADSNNKKRITLGDLPALGGSDSDAIHDNVAAEISAITAKGSPTTSDYLLIEDAADSNNKKSITIGNFPTINGIDGTAIHDNTNSEISAVAEKATPVSGDMLLIEDSAASNAKKRLTVGNLLAQTSLLSIPASINFIIDGGGSAITTGIKGDVEIPFACTINQVTLLADQSGSIVVDIWKDTYANFPPTDADSITASAVPTISTATKSQDATLTGWTTSISAGDILRFNVDSITTVTRVTLSLKVTRT